MNKGVFFYLLEHYYYYILLSNSAVQNMRRLAWPYKRLQTYTPAEGENRNGC